MIKEKKDAWKTKTRIFIRLFLAVEICYLTKK